MPLTGEAKKEYQRKYMRDKRDIVGQRIAKGIKQLVTAQHGGIRNWTPTEQDQIAAGARTFARSCARSNHITAEETFAQVHELSIATNTKVINDVATQEPNWDARRAGIVIKKDILEGFGDIPSVSQGPTSGEITVNVLMMNAGQSEPETKDLTVSNES